MSELLWQKPGTRIDERIQRFLAGEDVRLDRQLLAYDIRASRAHANGLQRIGVLAADECSALCAELDVLAADWQAGRFVLDERFEDMHSAIESRLIERLGDVGRKIHTGRSRNDQVLVALRLYLRDAMATLQHSCKAIADVALTRARADAGVAMPGYTHMQRAMVSSAGMWWAAWAEAFIDNAALTAASAQWVDANPLGTAAGYGVSLALDRDGSSAELGFSRTQINPIYAQLSRGKFELQALAALAQALLDLRRLAWDLSLFTSQEYGFVRLPAQYATGSSLMPNKRNPDLIELLRASYAVVAGARSEVEQLLSLPSGYHRDLQFSKGPLLRAFAHGLDALALLPGLLQGVQWDTQRMRDALEPGMYATDRAIELAQQGVPFRDAYRQAAEQPLPAAGADPDASLAARTSPGACADLRLDALAARLAALG
ncbi:MAG: argininosuccinate lyase [Gammaproteobacteria bacterium HGW-Gammaproteobacteria-2]|jgi:argininosuccinate lyase|nr:MAG: argininosuccinate lyase [Gammaproteobacteria bacterium HGW-Gammaproteobacteria-2]